MLEAAPARVAYDAEPVPAFSLSIALKLAKFDLILERGVASRVCFCWMALHRSTAQ
jgi:hypothetical protein